MSSTTQPPRTTLIRVSTFTLPQWEVLLALRERYRRERDFFDARERAHLSFMSWLYETGRLEP